MKKTIRYVSIVVILLTLLPLQSISAEPDNIWGVSIGDTFEWELFDNYYFIENATISEGVSQVKSFVDPSLNYRIEYENVKNWNEGDLGLNVSSSLSQVDSVEILVSYFTLSGNQLIYRTYEDYNGEKIETIIPSQISVLANGLYNEPYHDKYGKNVKTEVNGSLFHIMDEYGDYLIPYSVDFSEAGMVNISFYNAGKDMLYGFSYTFHYVSSFRSFDKKHFASYSDAGFSIKVIDIKDYDVDEDNVNDLLLLGESNISISTPIGNFGAGMPNYIDLTSFSSILAVFTLILSTSNSIQTSELLPFPVSLPSGVNVLPSDVAETMNDLVSISPTFVRDIVSPIVKGTINIFSINNFFTTIYTEGITLADLYNFITLLSFSNFLLLPKSMDLDNIGEAIDYMNSIMDSINSISETGNASVVDRSNMKYILSHAIDYNSTNDTFTLNIGNGAFPIIYDSRNGFADISAGITWKDNTMDCVVININYVSSGFGHSIGFSRVTREGGAVTETETPWYTRLTKIIITFLSILGGGAVAIVAGKKRLKKKEIPFKSVIHNGIFSDDCSIEGCYDR